MKRPVVAGSTPWRTTPGGCRVDVVLLVEVLLVVLLDVVELVDVDVVVPKGSQPGGSAAHGIAAQSVPRNLRVSSCLFPAHCMQ